MSTLNDASASEPPIVVIAGHFLVPTTDRDRFVAAHAELVERARSFDGCIHLAITADSLDPQRVDNAEIWESASALDAWRAQANAPDIDVEIIDGDVRRYDASTGGPPF